MSRNGNRRANLMLFVAAAGGLILGLASVFWSPLGSVTALGGGGVVATVNGKAIHVESYRRALQAMASDMRGPLRGSDEELLLRRLIEEELLIQAALRDGVIDTDPMVRKAFSDAMIAWILADLPVHDPSELELSEFYENNAALFDRYSMGMDTDSALEMLRAAFVQRRRDLAVAQYISWLRDQADIVRPRRIR